MHTFDVTPQPNLLLKIQFMTHALHSSNPLEQFFSVSITPGLVQQPAARLSRAPIDAIIHIHANLLLIRMSIVV